MTSDAARLVMQCAAAEEATGGRAGKCHARGGGGATRARPCAPVRTHSRPKSMLPQNCEAYMLLLLLLAILSALNRGTRKLYLRVWEGGA